MCGAYDYDAPEFVHSETRKARKPHQCYECGVAIQPGQRYEHTAGKWDGDVMVNSTCLRCVALRTAHVAAHRAIGEGGGFLYGGVLDEIRQCLIDEPGYRAPFRAALRKARLAVPR
jgi:hypothetical protein